MEKLILEVSGQRPGPAVNGPPSAHFLNPVFAYAYLSSDCQFKSPIQGDIQGLLI